MLSEIHKLNSNKTLEEDGLKSSRKSLQGTRLVVASSSENSPNKSGVNKTKYFPSSMPDSGKTQYKFIQGRKWVKLEILLNDQAEDEILSLTSQFFFCPEHFWNQLRNKSSYQLIVVHTSCYPIKKQWQ